jgi:hypothetical protein
MAEAGGFYGTIVSILGLIVFAFEMSNYVGKIA